ncbi:MAG: aromatic ring-hydroxylating oxygenase subunit alpha [Thermoplasmata archaeon]
MVAPNASNPPGGAGRTDHLRAPTPDGRVYWSEERYRQELDQLFFRSWLNLGPEELLQGTGRFLSQEIGPESIVVVRGSDGALHGFYNVCRHRGSRLTVARAGDLGRSIVCPYHAWTYGLDGRLLASRDTETLSDFPRDEFGLYPVRTESLAGFVWANLDPTAASLRTSFGAFFDRYDPRLFRGLQQGAQQSYTVEANWKLLVENFSECYHCAPVHPELNRITPYRSGGNDAWFRSGPDRSEFAGGWMELAEDYTSMVRSGHTRRPALPGHAPRDLRRISYYVLFPNLFVSLHPDYLMVHRAWPIGPTRSRVENEFYFAADAMGAPDFDPGDAVGLWDEINRQDWRVCELAQLGSRSHVWHGGRYSAAESMIYDFDAYLEERLGASGTRPETRKTV